MVEIPPPPPPVTAVIVTVADCPVAVAVTPLPTKLMDVILVAVPTLVPSSLMVIPLIPPPPPPVGAAGTHDDPFHVSTSSLLGAALETLDRLPMFCPPIPVRYPAVAWLPHAYAVSYCVISRAVI